MCVCVRVCARTCVCAEGGCSLNRWGAGGWGGGGCWPQWPHCFSVTVFNTKSAEVECVEC